MAGSYNHIVEEDGNLRNDEAVVYSLRTGHDVFEIIEEMYGMIWYLAGGMAGLESNEIEPDRQAGITKGLVEAARQNYKEGLNTAREVNTKA